MQRKLAIGLSSGLMLSTCLAAPARAQDIGGIINMFMNAAPHYGYHMRYSAPRRHYGYAYSYSPRRHYGYGYGYGHAYGYGYGLRRPYGEPGQPNASPENPTSTSDQNLVTNPTNPAPSVVGAADLIGAAAFVPNFLPPKPPPAPHGEEQPPGPAHAPASEGQIVKTSLPQSTSSFEAEIANFNNHVAAVGAPAIDRETIIAALNATYASAAVARLEILPDEGWTREVLQAHILRRAEDVFPEFSANLTGDAQTRDQTLAQLFSRAASEALPSALTEQEAVAFSASLKRYAQSRVSASETRGLGAG